MERVRSGHLAQFVAAWLLLWALADLVNVNLCAIDRPSTASPSNLHVAALVTQGSSASPSAFPFRGDDCFCCSHNVLFATVSVAAPEAGLVEGVCLPPIGHVTLLRTQLDHPPQLV